MCFTQLLNMRIHEIHDLTNKSVVDLLRNAMLDVDEPNLILNYHPDYSHEPGNLFYILQTGRYAQDRGKYYVITRGGEYVCSAGWNKYDYDDSIALLLTRMYVRPEYRCQFILGNMVLPTMIKETEQYKHRWITANNHNRGIYHFFERAASGKTTSLAHDWPDLYKQFKPIGQHKVYFTDQWVAEYRE